MCAKSHSPGTESRGVGISLGGGSSRWWARREGVEMPRSGFPNIKASLSNNGGAMLAPGKVWCLNMVTHTWSEGLCTWNPSKGIVGSSAIRKYFLIYSVQSVVQFL